MKLKTFCLYSLFPYRSG